MSKREHRFGWAQAILWFFGFNSGHLFVGAWGWWAVLLVFPAVAMCCTVYYWRRDDAS